MKNVPRRKKTYFTFFVTYITLKVVYPFLSYVLDTKRVEEPSNNLVAENEKFYSFSHFLHDTENYIINDRPLLFEGYSLIQK